MKNIFFVLFLFLSIDSIGQNSSAELPFKYLKKDNNQIFFEKVFEVDSANSSQIEQMLIANIPKTKDVRDFQKNSNVITAYISNCLIDYKKYGGKWGNTQVFMNHPFFSNVTVVWKDGKYKVTLSNMEWHTSLGNLTMTEALTKWAQGKEWDLSKSKVKAGQYVEQYFSDLFSFSEVNKSDW
ncbi:hypothetical protein LZD49_26205 [Dyadobacter sp. CY261]|uniref:hypothetical protein n=1 Tax=Dyadobacter sp. CY261 TaxID=2907203 RepID=UPI001F2A15D2|nr:hypothetical protein [Dyadobacter sp. CY261]MCF0074002.1 hypothetical protein [Dyadobacter sp. CY261]